MDTGIGAILREARGRRKIELSEVEAAIKIRIRYLTAMENEDWNALPGGPYTPGFIRTYASYLGLDGERLADEYRRSAATASGGQEGEQAPSPVPRRRRPASGRALPALAVGALAAAAIVVGLLGRGGGSSPQPAAKGAHPASERGGSSRRRARRLGTAIRLTARAEVWVCLLDGAGATLIDGQVLEAGAEEGPFRSGRFTISLGNGGVALEVDGEDVSVPETASPIGYLIDRSGRLRRLSEAERPTCT